jgi:hypothetical protein
MAQKIKAYEGMPPEEVRQVIRGRFREARAFQGCEEGEVTVKLQDTWRKVTRRVSAGQEQEEEDANRESEEEDTDPEWQSEEETRTLITRLTEDLRRYDLAVTQQTEEAVEMHIGLDELRNQLRKEDADATIQGEETCQRERLHEVTAKIRRNRRKTQRARARWDRETRGLPLEGMDPTYILSKLKMWGKGHLVMVRP